MKDHSVGTSSRRRSCKVQVKPVAFAKGTQVHLSSRNIPSHPLIQFVDAGTQTESSGQKNEDEDLVNDEEPDIEIGSDSGDKRKDPTYNPGRSRRNRSSSDEETCKVTQSPLLNDLKRMSPLAQTSSVEAFHSVLLYWCPKMLAYSYAGMKCRLYLAALHWNVDSNEPE